MDKPAIPVRFGGRSPPGGGRKIGEQRKKGFVPPPFGSTERTTADVEKIPDKTPKDKGRVSRLPSTKEAMMHSFHIRKGVIEVHNPDVAAEILRDAREVQASLRAQELAESAERRGELRKSRSMPPTTMGKGKDMQKREEWRKASHERRMNENAIAHEMSVRQQRYRKEHAAEDIHARILKEKEGLVKNVDDMLERHERSQRRRKELLCEEWNTKVYDKIQESVKETFVDYEERREIRKEAHEAYLKASSSGRGVFRDVQQAGYDPRLTNKLALRVTTDHIEDPLHRDERKMRVEREIILEGVRADKAEAIASGVSVEALDGKKKDRKDFRTEEFVRRLERGTSGSKSGKANRSTLVLDHFDTSAQGKQALVNAEYFGRSKKRQVGTKGRSQLCVGEAGFM